MEDVYKFRCSLVGHKSDVRVLSFPSATFLASGSRDFTVRTWHISHEGYDSSEGSILLGHQNYISAIAITCSKEDSENKLIYTGCHDGVIRIYKSDSNEPIHSLEGHKDTVCSLASMSDDLLVSGSWDNSIKVWKNNDCVGTLTGHKGAVWSVIIMPHTVASLSNDHLVIVSGSADRTICFWSVNTNKLTDLGEVQSPLKVLTGHTDCVRSLAKIDEYRFLSCSNDASIRAWHGPTGTCIGEFYGHTNFVYGLATLPGCPIFASCGEDRTVRVWKIPLETQWGQGCTFQCIQTISLPCQSAWCVALSPLHDIAVGGSDSTIRIFSSKISRQAPEDIQKVYNTELSKSQIVIPSSSGTGDLDLNNLPGPDALTRPGKSEGQFMVISDNGRPVCYQWSSHEYRWVEVGDVVGTQAPNRPVFEGKEYDFVFTVDISEDMPPLKLPYNRTEDPWLVAYNFIQKNDLPAGYLDTVANYIIQNAGPQLNPSSQGVDPLSSDPFTGGSRYIPGETSTTTKPSQTHTNERYLPSSVFVPIKSISLVPLMNKLELFNSDVDFPLSTELISLAKNFTFEWNKEQAIELTTGILNTIPKWSADKVFPLLDLLRCLVMWSECSKLIFSPTLWTYILSVSLNHTDLPSANCLLVLRLLANAVASDGPTYVAHSNNETSMPLSLSNAINIAPKLLQVAEDPKLNLANRKQHQIALSTLLSNLATLTYLSSSITSPQLRALPGICIRTSLSLLGWGPKNGPAGVTVLHPECVFSLLCCLGTCLLSVSTAADASATEMKLQRIRLLSSGAMNLDSNTSKDTAQTELDEVTACDKALKLIDYWAQTPAVSSKVRSCASELLRSLE